MVAAVLVELAVLVVSAGPVELAGPVVSGS
jgi:hypothetical protein